jgi:hypothetical protein
VRVRELDDLGRRVRGELRGTLSGFMSLTSYASPDGAAGRAQPSKIASSGTQMPNISIGIRHDWPRSGVSTGGPQRYGFRICANPAPFLHAVLSDPSILLLGHGIHSHTGHRPELRGGRVRTGMDSA